MNASCTLWHYQWQFDTGWESNPKRWCPKLHCLTKKLCIPIITSPFIGNHTKPLFIVFALLAFSKSTIPFSPDIQWYKSQHKGPCCLLETSPWEAEATPNVPTLPDQFWSLYKLKRWWNKLECNIGRWMYVVQRSVERHSNERTTTNHLDYNYSLFIHWPIKLKFQVNRFSFSAKPVLVH